MDECGGCLVCGEHDELGDLNVRRTCGTEENCFRDVFTRQRRKILIYRLCALFIAAEADHAEFRFNKTRVDRADSERSIDEIVT